VNQKLEKLNKLLIQRHILLFILGVLYGYLFVLFSFNIKNINILLVCGIGFIIGLHTCETNI